MARRKAKSIQQLLAESRKRDARGRFMPIERSQKTAVVPLPGFANDQSSTTVAEPPVVETQTDAQTPEAIEKQTVSQIGLLEALIKQRQEMGFETSELEKYVIGIGDQRGVRSVVEEFIKENSQQFNREDPAGAAAFKLMEETVTLSETSMKASREEAKAIYAKLKFIRELAKKTQGEQSAIAQKLDDMIAPVEQQLKKRTSFSAFLKEKAEDFRKTLPERIVSKIPGVGGILGQFLRERREQKEMLERYSGGLQEQIARGGKKSGVLDFSGIGQPIRSSAAKSMAAVGGVPASSIPGMLSATKEDRAGTATEGEQLKTLGEIHREITGIKTLLEKKFKEDTSDTAELSAREAELEAKRGYGSISASGAKSVTGGKDGAGGGGFLSNLLSGVTSMIMPSILSKVGGGLGRLLLGGLSKIAPNLAASISKQGLFKTAVEGVKTLGSKALGGIKSVGSSIANSNIVKSAVSMTKSAATKTANFIKESSLVKDTKSAFSTVKDVGGKALTSVKDMGGRAFSFMSDVGGKALGAAKDFGSKAVSTVSKAASPVVTMAKDVGGKALGVAKDMGSKAVSVASKVATPVATAAKSAAASVGSVLSSAGSTAAETAAQSGGWLSKAWGAVKDTASKLNPMKAVGTFVKNNAAKVAKGILTFPGVGSLISGAIGAYQISGIKSDPQLSEDEKKDQIGKIILTTLGGIIGSIGGGALGSLIPVPGIGTILGTVGGGMLGDYVAGAIGESVGGKAIYDMVSSIPGIGSLISVDSSEGEAGKEDKSGLSAVNAGASATEAAMLPTPMATETAAAITPNAEQATGIISPATPNTNLAQMVQRYNSETNALNQATAETQNQMLMANRSAVAGGNKTVNTNVSSTVNNFHDDLRQRNNEPTVKTMQANSVLW